MLGGDSAGFPNGRRPGDDVADIELCVAMDVLCTLNLGRNPGDAPAGGIHFTDRAFVDAHSDFLLDAGRPAEVAVLLKDKTRADGLLLRYALAVQALRSKDLPAQVEQLRARASRRAAAANLARESWRVSPPMRKSCTRRPSRRATSRHSTP